MMPRCFTLIRLPLTGFLRADRARGDTQSLRFWVSEIIACAALFFLMTALLSAPYLLGTDPTIDAEFMQGVK